MATENRDWGYRRIQGRTGQSGPRGRTVHHHHHSQGARLGTRAGAQPKARWKEFLSRHWEVIVAADFFTIEV